MTREELLKAYYDDRPTEPYSSDDCPTDWSRIAEYAENNLEKAYSRIAELEAYNEKLLDGDIEKHNKIVILGMENAKLKELVEKYRQAVDKCLHITFMGGGCEVNTIGQYATLVDGYLIDVEGLTKWKN